MTTKRPDEAICHRMLHLLQSSLEKMHDDELHAALMAMAKS